MQNKKAERGSVLLLELLVCALIVELLFCISMPNYIEMQKAQQARQALVALRAINQASAYFTIEYHNGFTNPTQLAALSPTGPNCDFPNLLPGQFTQPQISGYTFTFTLNPTPVTSAVGCSAPGAIGYVLTATPIVGVGRTFWTSEAGVIHFADNATADGSSPTLSW